MEINIQIISFDKKNKMLINQRIFIRVYIVTITQIIRENELT